MGNSIIVCGEKFNIGTEVKLYNENGFNAYDTSTKKIEDRKTGKVIVTSGKRYSSRGILNLGRAQLNKVVTQLFLHHTGNRTAGSTFETLHNERGLSVHFILDDNGVLYQTLDLKEKAFHGGRNNPCSIGVEICSRADAKKFADDYDEYHQEKYNVLPRNKRYDKIQGNFMFGFDYNDKQYEALISLTHALSGMFPNLNNPDFPRDDKGGIVRSVIKNPLGHAGLICHYNTSLEKWDPVCLDHERILNSLQTGVDSGSTYVYFTNDKLKQMFLKKMGYDVGNIDGKFGPQTKKCVFLFQSDNGLKSDGNWGDMTSYVANKLMKLKNITLD